MSKLVVALGGNALSSDGQATATAQQLVAEQTASQLVDLLEAGHQLTIVHGNGPQIGNIILHEEAINTEKTPTMPIDTCGAMSQGQIGYWLQQAFSNVLYRRGIKKPVATIITQVLVSPKDPALKNPTKPIGPFYQESEAKTLEKTRGFVVKADANRGWRRVVPSPRPIGIVEEDMLRLSVYNQALVIVAGGGGIPVYRRHGKLVGIEAVIDKDFAASKVAELVDADILLILTSIDSVKTNFGLETEETLSKLTIKQAEKLIKENQFAAGSMLPKIQAAIQFVSGYSKRKAIIASPNQALLALKGQAGTTILN